MLDHLAEIIENEGLPPHGGEHHENDWTFTRRNTQVMALLWFLFFVFCLVPLLAIVKAGSIPIAVLALIGTAGAVIIAVSSILLNGPEATGDPSSANSQNTDEKIRAGDLSRYELAPNRTESADEYVSPSGQRKDRVESEIENPPSVTEPTTKLLKKDGK